MILPSKFYLRHSYLSSLWYLIKSLLPQLIKLLRAAPEVKLKNKINLEMGAKNNFPILEVLDSETLKCISCGLCEKVCPTNCIDIVRSQALEINGSLGYGPPPDEFILKLESCIQCGLCEEVCPVGAITLNGNYNLLTLENTTLGIPELRKQAKLPKEEF